MATRGCERFWTRAWSCVTRSSSANWPAAIYPTARKLISLLRALPPAPVAGHDEVLAFIEARDLAGKGLGYVDAHLLAAAVVGGVSLWTDDRRLDKAALRLHCGYTEGWAS